MKIRSVIHPATTLILAPPQKSFTRVITVELAPEQTIKMHFLSSIVATLTCLSAFATASPGSPSPESQVLQRRNDDDYDRGREWGNRRDGDNRRDDHDRDDHRRHGTSPELKNWWNICLQQASSEYCIQLYSQSNPQGCIDTSRCYQRNYRSSAEITPASMAA